MVEPSRVEPSRVEAAGLLGGASDPVRWRLLAALSDGNSRCVCELLPVTGVAANLLPYHLEVLRQEATS